MTFVNSSIGQPMIQTITVDIHSGLFRIFQVSSITNDAMTKVRIPAPREINARFLLSIHFLCDAIGCLGVTEEVFASLFFYQAGMFQFKVSALNLAFIDGKLLRQRGGGRERCSGSEGLISDLRFNLFAHLQVHGAFGQGL